MNLVHITHEATQKMGGIGTVLEGLLTADAYQAAIDRTVLVGTWSLGSPAATRLGPTGSRILYSICDGIDEKGLRPVFRPIEETYQVWITYGTRTMDNRADAKSAEVEVLLIEAAELNAPRFNYFKATFYQRFGIASGDYEASSDYDHWMRIAEPAYEAAMALLQRAPTTFIAHEYMGMPTALKAVMENDPDVHTVLYAHEVATVRPHVENHPGHDTRFYNLMRQARGENRYIEDVLGSQWTSYRHALIDRAQFCDAIFAVGDEVVEEYRFLSPACADAPISLVYNGAPARKIAPEERRASKGQLVQYCENLLGYRPDVVFTHVTRLVQSKAMWRDVRVLEHLDRLFDESGQSGALFILSTEVGPGRSGEDAHRMEREYGWPVHHREGWPDLVGSEVGFFHSLVAFNARSRAIKIVFVNQFGWSRERCGNRMPEDMSFMDIRQGTDVEFGQSIYEPFGIAQVEPLSFGSICVVSNVCGCVGFVRNATGGEDVRNMIVADYTELGGGYMGVGAVAQIGWAERDAIERRNSAVVAELLFESLPKTDAEAEKLLAQGYEIGKNMSWEVVASDYFLPALNRAIGES